MGGNAARPKHRDLVSLKVLWFAPIRSFDVSDPKFAWVIDIERRAMRVRVLFCDTTRSVCVFGRNRAHRYHEWSAKRPDCVRCAVGTECGDIATPFKVAKVNARIHERFFE